MTNVKGGENPSRGEIWLVDFNPTRGHEQAGSRPALIISDDALNRSPAGLVIVTPVTTSDRRIPAHVRVTPPDGGLDKPSVILVDQIRTISKDRLGRRLGTVSETTLQEVEESLRLVLSL